MQAARFWPEARQRLPAITAALALLSASFSVSYTQSFLGLSLLFSLIDGVSRRRERTIPLPFLIAGALFAWLILDWIILFSLGQENLRGLLRGEAADLFLCLFGLSVFWIFESDEQNRRILFFGFLGFGSVMVLSGTASLFTEHRLARLIYGKGFLATSETRPQHLFGIYAGIPIYRPIGLLNNRLTYAGLLVLLLPVMIHLALAEKGRIRIAAGAIAAASLPLLFANGTRSALAGLLVSLTWIFFLRLPGLLRLPVAAFLLTACAAGAFFASGLLRQTDFQRPILWTAAFDLFQSAPLTGTGPGQFEPAFTAWKTTASERMPLAWYYLESTPRGHAHNDLLHLLAVGGILAGALFAALMAVSMRGKWGKAGVVLSGAAGFFTAGLAQCYYQDDETVVLFWVVLALSEHLRRATERENGIPYS